LDAKSKPVSAAEFWTTTRKNYRGTFFEKYKNLSPDDIHNVHHAVPKE